MTARRIRDVVLGLVLAGVSFLGVLYQVNETTASEADGKSGEVPRLLCPLH
jgi:hypothetical protein